MQPMISKCYLLLLLPACLILMIPSYHANQIMSSCKTSSCGHISNISYPFRLQDDPEHCSASSDYVISCRNNSTPSLYLNSYEFHVRAINYNNFTIRLAHPDISHNDSCSFPKYSLPWKNFNFRYNSLPIPYVTSVQRLGWEKYGPWMVLPITFVSCPSPLDDPLSVETCDSLDSNSSTRRHRYIKAGDFAVRDLKEFCSLDLMVMTSLRITETKDKTKISLTQIHKSLLYGFELSWSLVNCNKTCNRTTASDACVFDGIKAVCPKSACYHRFLMMSLESELVIRNVSFKVAGIEKKQTIVTCRKLWYFIPLKIMMPFIGLLIGFFVVTRIFIGVPFVIAMLTYKFKTRHMSMFNIIEIFLQSENSNLLPIRYSYLDIKKMTKGFREKLGRGGYASVYKGKLRSGGIVAVKVLSHESADGQDFINEVATIGRIHHVNVVRLIGYCVERSKRALIYDFMPNGSLDKYIFSDGNDSLSWEKKYEIAVGVARGIDYLHLGCNIQILHFDIKPHNILLDENFTPKISDFGLAKFFATDKNTVTLTAARGTIGYLAPELINRSIGRVSYKADVYSYGMLLMEMLGLKRNLAPDDGNSSQYFPDWIYDQLEKEDRMETGHGIYESEDDECCSKKKKKRMTVVGLWCVQTSPSDRPSMSRVVELLEKEDEPLQAPPKPYYDSIQQAGLDEDELTLNSGDSIALLADE